MAYCGNPVPLDTLLFETEHSLIDQSLSARQAVEPTNADGFGIGWYGRQNRPGLYRSVRPAWNDANLRDLAFQIESKLFLAHVRRSTGTPVQNTNCHPFRHGDWLFVHNGSLQEHHRYRRDLVLALAPEHFNALEGTTDSELMFRLALTLGLDEEPLPALERMVGAVERAAGEAGVEDAVQMTLGLADGERLYAVRYSTEGRSRTLYLSESVETVEALYPELEGTLPFAEHSRVVVSEPLSDRPGVWVEVPESTALVVQAGEVERTTFTPRAA
jgi:glutamine amidotransferase